MGTFSERGEAELKGCAVRLQEVMRLAKDWSYVDFDIVQGPRTIEKQREYFAGGKSKVNPDAYANLADLYKAAKHVTGPGMRYSRACDIKAVSEEGPYDIESLCVIAGAILAAAKHLGVKVRWGADWTGKGRVFVKGTFIDAPHFEIDD